MGNKPIYERDVLHEIIHEYQFKCVKEYSSEGINLMNNSGRGFSGCGHDEMFYTAIVICAAKLQMTPEELKESI